MRIFPMAEQGPHDVIERNASSRAANLDIAHISGLRRYAALERPAGRRGRCALIHYVGEPMPKPIHRVVIRQSERHRGNASCHHIGIAAGAYQIRRRRPTATSAGTCRFPAKICRANVDSRICRAWPAAIYRHKALRGLFYCLHTLTRLLHARVIITAFLTRKHGNGNNRRRCHQHRKLQQGKTGFSVILAVGTQAVVQHSALSNRYYA